MALWEKLSCQDVLRRGSPLRQEVGQSSTALWITAVLQPEVPSLSLSMPPFFFSLGCFFSFFFFSDSPGPASLSVCPHRPPPLAPAGPPPLSFPFCLRLSDPSRCPLLFFDQRGQRPMTLGAGLDIAMTTPQSAPPEASARTRCRLMASSRNPATFSLSSYAFNRKK